MEFKEIFGDKPWIIAGPCSAETLEQTLDTAKQLAANGIKVFRAGIWKPRTRPGNFEGVGEIGLEWLRQVKKETGMFTAVEVANSKHVWDAIRGGVDILWIGARSSANPFVMQEIADGLRGCNIPVLVKNPVNPDVELWLGAIERLEAAGLTNIGVIHRGFSSYEKILYRNAPIWQMPIELRRRRPDLPIICDPSHIAGKREYLKEISQKALDLNVDGLMIESHCNPDKAWSDAKQQLTPEALKQMLSELVVRKVNPENASMETLNELRFKIDQIDNEIISTLKKRMGISEKIGEYKKANNMTVLQQQRWDSLLEKYYKAADENNLDKKMIDTIFKAIHQASINVQSQIVNEK
ncbi:MAG: bifunctional 3-deoxy-7-phosphoheptulonate synthase/chorismate mutase type II [Bacteroidales bacterium]|jgi:chorismate mutase|nr:bifunctional 3-deoxy-7-phosphoheptulonate synthase/chorismate mutase type II [Bacteroidales bacterium]MBR6277803.1 bifunctional 3-deoxy-7-phosphoheptulonate synthase/chorismate mutase type II [Bacteroidales bacterium]